MKILLRTLILLGVSSPSVAAPLARGPLTCNGDLELRSLSKPKTVFSTKEKFHVDPSVHQKLEVVLKGKVIAAIFPLYGLDSEKKDATSQITTDGENFVSIKAKDGNSERSLHCEF